MDLDQSKLIGACELIKLPAITDPRGDLTFLEANRQIPFPISRVYYLYNTPVDSVRGGHAHKKLRQVLFALSGSFRVTIDDGGSRQEHWLRSPRVGLMMGPMIWRDMDCFSHGSICMVAASDYYDEEDYIRDYDDFLAAVKAK